MKRRILSLTLCVTLSATLAGCQRQSLNSSIHINDASAEAVTLSMFAPVGSGLNSTDSFRDLTLDYNAQHSDVQVSFDSVSTADGYDRFLEQRLDAGNEVDVFLVNAENVKQISQKEQFYDLSSLEGFHTLTESAREQAMVDGIAYTIPLSLSVYIMNVNVSLLERYGLDVPQNYDEFMHCCQVLKAHSVTPISLNRWFSMTAPVMARGLYPLYQAENHEELIAGLNSGEIKIGDYMIDGFHMLEEFLQQGYYGDRLVMEEVDALKAGTQDAEDFYQSHTAFYFVPLGNNKITEAANGDACIYTALPLLPDGAITLPSISNRLCVNANSEHLAESIAFADYLVTHRQQELASDPASSLSPFHQAAASDTTPPWMQDILACLDAGGQIPIEDMNVHFGYWDNTRKLCLAMVGGMSAEEAAAEFNRIQTEELQAYSETDKS